MKDEELQERADKVAAAIEGLEVMEAVDVIGKGCMISSKKDQTHALINIYIIGKMIEECHAEKAVVKIKRDGSLSFQIIAGKEKKLSI